LPNRSPKNDRRKNNLRSRRPPRLVQDQLAAGAVAAVDADAVDAGASKQSRKPLRPLR